MNPKDRFSEGSADYRQYRPHYPPALFRELASLCPQRERAWDCACGSGQAALGLAPYFEEIVGTDVSTEQLRAAMSGDNIRYLTAPAEQVPLASGSVDLITVAQALHWFDQSAFFAECQRVLKPGGVLALWSYNLLSVSERVDAVIVELYWNRLGDYWDPERKQVEEGYASVDFPFESLPMPALAMRAQWSVEHLLGYLHTWSAVKRYQQSKGTDPVAELEQAFREAWGNEPERGVQWPLALHVGRIG